MNDAWRIDFAIVGAQKCGTTTLDAMLRAHPQIVMCQRKEAHFFDQPTCDDYEAYHKLFPPVSPGEIAGEASPSYLYVDGAIENLQRYSPSVKTVVILRNPATRAFSHWNMLRMRGEIDLPFGEAIRQEAKLVGTPGDRNTKKFAFLGRGRYSDQLKRLRANFPANQCFISKFETFFSDLETSTDALLAFLGVRNVALPRYHERDGGNQTGMNSDDRRFIYDQLKDDLAELQTLVDFDISDWVDYIKP